MFGRNYTIVSAPRMGSIAIEWDSDPGVVYAKAAPGPWQEEPDWIAWRDSVTDLRCKIRRNGVGALCGYVCVGDDWDGNPASLDVHGGVTFDGALTDEPTSRWLGFDCAHYGDVSPVTLKYSDTRPGETYKDIHFVYRECSSLAWQANRSP